VVLPLKEFADAFQVFVLWLSRQPQQSKQLEFLYTLCKSKLSHASCSRYHALGAGIQGRIDRWRSDVSIVEESRLCCGSR